MNACERCESIGPVIACITCGRTQTGPGLKNLTWPGVPAVESKVVMAADSNEDGRSSMPPGSEHSLARDLGERIAGPAPSKERFDRERSRREVLPDVRL